ncbi:hypothetical protein Halhy_6747 (plasmid) [Haliscomenobacter hydrossis DSM 1100]|uniref:Uncharacterized protein n=1 Tax=Haliscomenobacter hydrossis (strain ATCC 27775 / DSM 1100 / LMG 10767 / O) TaxID=760192 RepID=F4L853_HALH1|nr:hypothetical protein Halhy_6747 [Haliscomenobacter hydrossis DSM 1100]
MNKQTSFRHQRSPTAISGLLLWIISITNFYDSSTC